MSENNYIYRFDIHRYPEQNEWYLSITTYLIISMSKNEIHAFCVGTNSSQSNKILLKSKSKLATLYTKGIGKNFFFSIEEGLKKSGFDLFDYQLGQLNEFLKLDRQAINPTDRHSKYHLN